MATNNLEFIISQKGAEKTKSQIAGLSGAVSNLAKTMGLAVTAGLAVRKIMQTFSQSISLAREQITVERMIEQQIRATSGAAGIASQQLFKMAAGLQAVSNIGDEGILRNLTLPLLTFKQVAGETFERTQEAAMDLNAVIGDPNNPASLRSSAIMLGKALNDPITGLTAMRRVGISFTQSQQDMIRSLAETGDMLGAQALILDELDAQFGGAAKAGVSAAAQLKNAWGDYLEGLGSRFLPVFDGISRAMTLMLMNATADFDFTSKSAQLAALETQESWGKATINVGNTIAEAATFITALADGILIAFDSISKAIPHSITVAMEASYIAVSNTMNSIVDLIVVPFEQMFNGIDTVFAKITGKSLGIRDIFNAVRIDTTDAKGNLDVAKGELELIWDGVKEFYSTWGNVVSDIWTGKTDPSEAQIEALKKQTEEMRKLIMNRKPISVKVEDQEPGGGIGASLDTAAIENYYLRMMNLNASSTQEVIDSHNEMRDSLWQYLEATVTDLRTRNELYRNAEAEIAQAEAAALAAIRQSELDAERRQAAEVLGIKVAALQGLEGYQSEYLALRFQQIDAETEKLRQAGLDQVMIAAWVASERAKAQSEANPEIESKLTELQEIYAAAGRNIRTSLEGTIGNALNGLLTQQQSFADAMRDLWKNMANAVIAEISRMIAKMLILKVISAITGVPLGGAPGGGALGGGGILGGSLNLQQAPAGYSPQSFAPIGKTQNNTLADRIDRLVSAIENNPPQIYTQKIEGIPFYNAIRRAEMVTNEL